MTTSPILPTPPAIGGTTAGTTVAGGLGPDAFLKLLVAQLEYQDPTNPADPTQFLAETAQFTQVQSLNTLTTQSASSLEATQNTTAAALLGKWIDATGTNGNDVTGIVTGMRITTNGPELEIGNVTTPLSNVQQVLDRAPSAPPTSPPATPTPTSTSSVPGTAAPTAAPTASGTVPAGS